MCRILQVDKIDCGKWTKIIPKVHQQAELEALTSQRISNIFSRLTHKG